MLKVERMYGYRSNTPVNNQYVIKGPEFNIFQSYETLIAKINMRSKTILVSEDYKCSSTTSRWRNQFFSEAGFSGLSSTSDLDEAIAQGNFGEWRVRLVKRI